MKTLLRLTIILLLFSTSNLYAEIRLPRIFCNNMVIQRNMEVKIYGWADAYERVEITFLKKKQKTKADKNGNWQIKLPAQIAGGPYEMQIKGENTIELKNIMFGDVWICSGQSNMYFRVAAAKNAYLDINDANYENIRLFQIDKDANYQVKTDLASGEWLKCTPENVKGFSAVAYFFGRELHKEIDVPIGLIHTSWGGSAIQAWIDGDSYKEFPEYYKKVKEIQETPDYFEKLEEKYNSQGGDLEITELYKKSKGLKNKGKTLNTDFFTEKNWKPIKVPGYWADFGIEKHEGMMWYKKQFELPNSFINNDLLLNLGWIDDFDFTFFNGKKIGSTWYKGSERKYTISKELLRTGTNEIIVGVYNYSWTGGFWGPRKSKLKIKNDTTLLNIDLQGLWQYKKGINRKDFLTEKLKKNKKPSKRSTPTFLYNAMIAPLTNFTIKGVAWYQGESNAGNVAEYSKLLPAMINGWRKKWNQADLPFLIVQLPNFGTPNEEKPENGNWAEFREVQFNSTKLKNVGITCTIDLGDAMDIHPTKKQEVGRRLMLSALKTAYNKKHTVISPNYKSIKITDNKAIISFENVGGGLITKNKFGYLSEFAIAGKDKKFVWAKAYIVGDKVFVYSDKVQNAVAVRYAWSGNPAQINFYNKEGLPVMPFRTDNWEFIK